MIPKARAVWIFVLCFDLEGKLSWLSISLAALLVVLSFEVLFFNQRRDALGTHVVRAAAIAVQDILGQYTRSMLDGWG